MLGPGHGWINLVQYEKLSALYSPLLPPLLLLVLLLFLKILATSFSLASGGSGGVFVPGFFICAYTGAVIGLFFKYLYPDIVPSVAPFIIVGITSFFAAAGKVPIATLLMATEMTSGLQILPGAMLAIAASFLVSGDYTIYASQLRTRAESPVHREDYALALMETVRVGECRVIGIKVSAWDKASDAATLMREKGFTSLPVVGLIEEFLGVVYLKDLERAAGDDIVLKYTIKKR